MNKTLLKAALVIPALVVAASNAQAVATLQISDGVNTVTIADGSGTDNSGITGIVGWSGSIGVWEVTVSGKTKPSLAGGTATDPKQSVISISASSDASGNLTILFGDTDYGPVSQDANFVADITPSKLGNSMTYNTYADLGNTLFGNTTAITSSGVMTVANVANIKSASTASTVGTDASFALTSAFVITHGKGIKETTFDATLNTVPDAGASVALLGMGLLGLGIFRRRIA